MNPIVFIGLKNSNDCTCNFGMWFKDHEFINPRMEYNVLIVDDLTDGSKNVRKRLDCYHIDNRPHGYSYVNLTFKFKNGEERQYNLINKQQLAECLQMMEEYVANGNDLEVQSKFEVNNEVEFMDI
jgi:hypothetical protein